MAPPFLGRAFPCPRRSYRHEEARASELPQPGIEVWVLGGTFEYIPTRLMSNHAQWDSQWFYLRNDEGLLPPYTGQLITARPLHWRYDITMEQQPQLRPLLGALQRLREEGLTIALVLLVVHPRRVLLLMAHPLRMYEMSPRAMSRDLEVCRMSSEALPNKVVAARVRAVISSAFQVEDVNLFPMKTKAGYIAMLSIPSNRVSSRGIPSPVFHI